mmetsp:Transcript_17663/g.26464  ORF Transcript_17663/g.26464 Transcript_17663/m.26464 type:complete len:263 (+) Transcript_17663:253-1041(+)|eukprot:CAMPEP_0167753666 /NCGR_PEP_ID=MMETSP0110_2-20121227/7843_1 /TAXON_ID=629695 /ORGANISM="Gymnochlora sp., Strain CCMP2014" /LENGTH=262 /DNA_ID=CAMNT_0007639463 /DNA_START=233 /DNA_END=1021 /DNA_ORIENTATION=+
MSTTSRYNDDELKLIVKATKEFMQPNGYVQWKPLFEKYKFPGRTESNIKVKYNSIRRKQLKRHRDIINGHNSSNGWHDSALEQFTKKKMAELKKGDPKLEEAELQKKVEKMWAKLSPSERESFKPKKEIPPKAKRRKAELHQTVLTAVPANGSSSSSRTPKSRKKMAELKMYEEAIRSNSHLPANRIRRVMNIVSKTNISKEAVGVMAKATEMFLLWLAEKSAKVSGLKKLSVDGVVAASKSQEAARFLRVALFNDFVPSGM